MCKLLTLNVNSMNARLFTFTGGDHGLWKVLSVKAVTGESLGEVRRLEIISGATPGMPVDALWQLRGATSNERYVTRDEKAELVARQKLLGRPEAAFSALIPIRKNAQWWALTQEERRAVFEDTSHHIQLGLKYLPAVARRLHHCRDLAETEPFDFLTLFDYAEADATAFEELVATLRSTEEWKYVDREVDIRMVRDSV